MTRPIQAPVAAPLDPATALADALQSGFAAQRNAHQRRRRVETQ
jgi:hypothetical protein